MTALPYPTHRTPEGERTAQDRKFRRRARRMFGRTITARRPGVCDECQEPTARGDQIVWAPQAGIAHVDCHERAAAEYDAHPVHGRTDAQVLADYHLWRSGARMSDEARERDEINDLEDYR